MDSCQLRDGYVLSRILEQFREAIKNDVDVEIVSGGIGDDVSLRDLVLNLMSYACLNISR
jgi:hypothetical protein